MSGTSVKRRKYHFNVDGTKIVSLQTLQRRKNSLSLARTAESLAVINSYDQVVRQQSVVNDPPTELSFSCMESHSVEEEVGRPLPADFENMITSCENEGNLSSSSYPCEAIQTTFEDEVPYCDSVQSDSSENESVGPSNDNLPLSELSSPTVADPSSPILSHTATDYSCMSFNVDKVKDYILSDGDTIMFREANLKTWQVILVILGICTRFSLSIKARRALIEATKLFAGPRFSGWDISDYYLSKIFDAPDEVIQYHFYCQVCCKELEKAETKDRFKNHETVCDKCLQKYTLSMNSPNYFISIDLKYQLTSLLNSTVVKESLLSSLKNIDLEARTSGIIRDVYDGLLYRKLFAETPKESQLLTYVFNTDGAPLFNSSKRSFWPILVILNELPPDLRFRYPLLAGLCIVRKEPSADMMSTYMKSFVIQANRLATEGFHLKIGEKPVHFVLKPLLCSVDSVARPLLQNRLQFNGYHGCSWCYSMGVHKHGCMRFLMEENDPADRTHTDYLEDVRAATKKSQSFVPQKTKLKKSNVRGVKGNSIVTDLIGFDMIWAFVRDYLHADLIGTVLQLWTMWCDHQCPIHLTRAQQDDVNVRLMRMTPPHEVHRLVRPLKSEKCKWKASEWRSWLLFYSIPCLTGILDEYALQHFGLLVNSIFKLLETSISEEVLATVEYDLNQFVVIFELLYGEKYVTFNIHSLKHLVNCVRHCGPLWATSTFPFESTIHNLKLHVHGPKGVYEQMATKAVQTNVFHSLVAQMEQSPGCLAFHRSLFGSSQVASFCKGDGVVLIGKGRPYLNSNQQSRYYGNREILSFQRCIVARMVVHAITYDRPKKSNDTMFIDKDGNFLQVSSLLYCDNFAFAKVSCFNVTTVILPSVDEECRRDCPEIENVLIGHLYKIDKRIDDIKIVGITDLREKCVVIDIDDHRYVSRLPNTFEIQ